MFAAAVALNKHQQKSEATRRKLLVSARRVFARAGFEAARIEDIAAEAGHTRGAFYANFDSKETLFLALLQQQTAEHMNCVVKRLQCCPSAAEKLAALRNYYLERASDRQWSMLMLEFKLFAVRHPRVRAKVARAYRDIRSAAQVQLEGVFAHELKNADNIIRVSLEASLHGLVLQNAYDPESLPQPQMASVLGQLFDTLTGS